MKDNKIITFIKYNFRLPVTILLLGIIVAAAVSIYKIPAIDQVGNSVRYSLIAFGIIFTLCLIIVFKLIRDLIGILLFNKSEKSVINKSSIKK